MSDVDLTSIIRSFNEQEKELYNEMSSVRPMFSTSDKDSLNNVSPLYRISLVQNNMHLVAPTLKTRYVVRKDYPTDLKKVLDYLNSGIDGDMRYKLLIIKSILMNRHFNPPEAQMTDYDDFTIKGGSLITCPNCMSNRVTIENKNNRSADEPTITFYQCLDCKKQFNEKVKYLKPTSSK